ncbi:hypothetical protein [Litoreibacter arenae]|uniref:hypothetical protein n=1 Tax=Litoreibacter arenae TaxID=491388 RepID=UPI0012B62860|nr:hypothetical protein [Litoreibacter arenae]
MSQSATLVSSENYKLSDLKLQIIHNMALDENLSPSATKVALVIITALLDGKSGWCFRTDVELASCAGISVDTLRRNVKKSPSFRQYFEIRSGRYKGLATEYQLIRQAMLDGARRRDGKLSNTTRANGESAINSQKTQTEAEVRESTGSACDGGKNSNIDRENLPHTGRQNHPPITVPKSSSIADCKSKLRCETIEPMFSILERFTNAYPREGNVKKVKATLASSIAAGVSPDAIIDAAAAYAFEQKGVETRFIKLPENWLSEKDFSEVPTPQHNGVTEAVVLQNWAKWINEGSGLGRTCSSDVVHKLLELGLVTRKKCLAAGLSL